MAKRIVCASFQKPVYKSDASGNVIEVGDTLGVRLHQAEQPGDGDIYDDVTVTHVQEDGRKVCWDALAESIEPVHVAGVDQDHNPPECP